MSDYRNFAKDLRMLCQELDQTLIVYSGVEEAIEYSYKDTYKLIERYVAFFKKNGLKPGDTIATVLPNSPEAILAYFAADAYGLSYAPLPCTASEREYNNWNNLTKPSFYIVKKGILDFDLTVSNIEVETDGTFDWLPAEAPGFDLDDSLNPKVYLLTSGTTGTPKAMQIDMNKLWSAGYAFASHYDIIASGVRFWNYLPMSYLGGLYNLAMIPLCCKGSFVISEPFSGKTMLNFWNFVKKYEITAIWFVPSIVRGLLKIYSLVGSKYADLYKSIRVSFLGTAPIDNAVKEEFEASFGIHLYENFALSETTFLTAETASNIRFREQSSVGECLPYVEIKLKPIEAVENTNEIWVKTPYLFDGYLDADGSLLLDVDEDGFFNSKDLGYYNEDGQLVLAGRSRDIIKKGGLFVSLVEVENLVSGIDYVDEVTAVPIKHDFYGEAYVLCVIFKKQDDIDHQIETLRKFLTESIVPYKLPEKIVSMKEFPRTASGKIQKKEIAANL